MLTSFPVTRKNEQKTNMSRKSIMQPNDLDIHHSELNLMLYWHKSSTAESVPQYVSFSPVNSSNGILITHYSHLSVTVKCDLFVK